MRIKAVAATAALLIAFAVVGALGLARTEPEPAREESEFHGSSEVFVPLGDPLPEQAMTSILTSE